MWTDDIKVGTDKSLANMSNQTKKNEVFRLYNIPAIILGKHIKC